MTKRKTTQKSNTLNWLGLAVSLTTLHYGLGFLIGSGEAVYSLGSLGILYAVSTAIGILSLLFIYKYYLKKKRPIWTLMSEKYGLHVGESIALLSSIWMIGVVASQVLGGASVLHTFGIHNQLAILFMAVVITILSLVNLKKLVTFFSIMLFLSSASILFILSFLGFEWVGISLVSFTMSLPTLRLFDLTGVILPTVLVTFIGMDFHQFLIKTKSRKDAFYGILASGGMLLVISLLLLSLINAAIAQNMLTAMGSSKQAIPLILKGFGGGFSVILEYLLTIPIILVAIGSGSGVNRIVNKSITSSWVLPSFLTKKPNVFVLIFAFVVLTALSGESIISLIVSFYAIYVGSVFFPFLAFLLDTKYSLHLKKSSIMFSISASVVSMLFVFFLSYIPNSFIGENKTSYMLVIGFLVSCLVLGFGNKKRFMLLLFNKRHVTKVKAVHKSPLHF